MRILKRDVGVLIDLYVCSTDRDFFLSLLASSKERGLCLSLHASGYFSCCFDFECSGESTRHIYI